MVLENLATRLEAGKANCNFIRLDKIKIDSVFFIQTNWESWEAFLDVGESAAL